MRETKAEYLPIEKLRPFEGHPFKVEYEVISGHRRLHACKKAGLDSIPAIVTDMDRDAATIAMVDSNLHREHILPSEKAFAYKLKAEAMHHQGRTSGQVGQKWTRDEVANGESGRQVQRYIRLTHLIPNILRMVDDGKIALTPAVEISYLTKLEQADLLETMECEDCTPSLSQAMQLKQLSQAGELDMDTIFGILTQLKPNQQEKISFKVSELRSYFPRSYTTSQMTRDILKGLELLRQRREQNRDSR